MCLVIHIDHRITLTKFPHTATHMAPTRNLLAATHINTQNSITRNSGWHCILYIFSPDPQFKSYWYYYTCCGAVDFFSTTRK